MSGDQNARVFQMQTLVRDFTDQVGEDTSPDILHVRCAFTEIGVFHIFEDFNVFSNGLFESVGSAMPIFYLLLEFFDKTAILENHQMRVKDRCVAFTEALGDALFKKDGLDAGLLKSTFKFFQLFSNVDLSLVKNVGEAEALFEDCRRADCNTRVSDNAGELLW